MKENKKIMNEKISQIGQTVIECLNNRKFNKVLLGLIVVNKNENDIRNMEFFYRDLEDKLVYFNEVVYSDSFDNSIEEQKYLELQDLLYDLRNYCVSYGDKWKYMTMVISNDGNFNIDFEYDSIEITEWRKLNGLLN